MNKSQIMLSAYLDDLTFIKKQQGIYRANGKYVAELVKDMVKAYKEKFENDDKKDSLI